MLAASFPLPVRRLQDDAQGLATGTLLAAFGVFLMQQAGLVPGGPVGIALLLHFGARVDLGAALFVVNLPFYALAWLRLGRAFALRTALSVSLLALSALAVLCLNLVLVWNHRARPREGASRVRG